MSPAGAHELSDVAKADLASLATRLEALAAGLAQVEGELVWGVPRRVVRAYVWAVHQGANVEAACTDAWFGASDDHKEAVRKVGAAWMARLDSFRLNIPLADPAGIAS